MVSNYIPRLNGSISHVITQRLPRREKQELSQGAQPRMQTKGSLPAITKTTGMGRFQRGPPTIIMNTMSPKARELASRHAGAASGVFYSNVLACPHRRATECQTGSTSSTAIDIDLSRVEDGKVAVAAAPARSAEQTGMVVVEEDTVHHQDLVIAAGLGHTRIGIMGVLQFDTAHTRDIGKFPHNMISLMGTAFLTLNSTMLRLLITAVTGVLGERVRTADRREARRSFPLNMTVWMMMTCFVSYSLKRGLWIHC